MWFSNDQVIAVVVLPLGAKRSLLWNSKIDQIRNGKLIWKNTREIQQYGKGNKNTEAEAQYFSGYKELEERKYFIYVGDPLGVP